MKAAVVGAGIMGQLLALNLLQIGWEVSLFDRRRTGEINCSLAAAGLLTPVTELTRNEWLIYQLGIEAISQHWPEIFRHIAEPVYFHNQGSLVLAHPRDHAELSRLVRILTNKLPAHERHEQIIAVKDVTRYEPELTQFDSAYYFPMEGCLDNQGLLQELEKHLIHKGVRYYQLDVYEIRGNFIILDDMKMGFDKVFDCRGLAAKDRFSDLRGVRGELIMIHAPEVILQHPLRLLNPRYSLYVAPRPQQIYILGASEIEAEDNSEISVKTLLELLSSAYYLHPGFAEARIIKTLTHSRPTLSDQLPRIKYSDGCIAINGLYRHGFLIAPTLAVEVLLFLRDGISAVNYPQLWERFDDEYIV